MHPIAVMSTSGLTGEPVVEVAGVLIEPPEIVSSEAGGKLLWSDIERDSETWLATAAHEHGLVTAELRAGPGVGPAGGHPERRGSYRVDWTLRWASAARVAVEIPFTFLHPEPSDAELFLPVVHDGNETRGSGLYPSLRLDRGFAVRADRLPQVAAVVAGPVTSLALVAPDDSPRPVVGGLLFSLVGGIDRQSRLRLALRYPQAEWGHVDGAPPAAAYVAKGMLGAGEDRRREWRPGDLCHIALWLVPLSPSVPVQDRSAPARMLWPGRRVRWRGPLGPLDAARARRDWMARHLWDEALGQYVSPEGAHTALAGFVEMSLSMPVAVVRLGLLEGATHTGQARSLRSFGRQERADRDEVVARAFTALDTWLSEGLGADGSMLPVRDDAGFRLGRRQYEDHVGLRVTGEPIVETIRPIAEARAVLGLIRHAGPAALGDERWTRYRAALHGVARWLCSQVSDEGLPAVIAADGGARRAHGGATAGLVALLADLSRDGWEDAERASQREEVIGLYERALRPLFHAGRFGGVTLDAACPDREGVLAALEAALAVHEATDAPGYLEDARMAVDALLPYVFAYPIRSFPPGTDASERGISTLGASVVSPENQQLDPYPVGVALVRYGLAVGDRVAVRAGLANVSWCLDGRWALHTGDGVRQSEQFNHTAWHYNAFFSQRGDFRRGMPVFGLIDSEHGWAQVLPILALLELGEVTLDWRSGRATSLEPRLRPRARRIPRGFEVQVARSGQEVAQPGRPMLLRILRPPHAVSLALHVKGEVTPLPWPSTLASVGFPAASGFEVRVAEA
jgi:hypothetical protein